MCGVPCGKGDALFARRVRWRARPSVGGVLMVEGAGLSLALGRLAVSGVFPLLLTRIYAASWCMFR